MSDTDQPTTDAALASAAYQEHISQSQKKSTEPHDRAPFLAGFAAALRAPAQVEGEAVNRFTEMLMNGLRHEFLVSHKTQDAVENMIRTVMREALTRPTAAPDGQGNICDCCNHSFLSVYRVPNDVWRKIAPKPDTLGDFEEHLGGGVLCLSCAERRAGDQGCPLVFDGLNDWLEASGEAVRLLSEARNYVDAEADSATDDDCEGLARDLLGQIDAYLTRKGAA